MKADDGRRRISIPTCRLWVGYVYPHGAGICRFHEWPILVKKNDDANLQAAMVFTHYQSAKAWMNEVGKRKGGRP